jgi:hypothetical protein
MEWQQQTDDVDAILLKHRNAGEAERIVEHQQTG